jgi:hypothetical protein
VNARLVSLIFDPRIYCRWSSPRRRDAVQRQDQRAVHRGQQGGLRRDDAAGCAAAGHGTGNGALRTRHGAGGACDPPGEERTRGAALNPVVERKSRILKLSFVCLNLVKVYTAAFAKPAVLLRRTVLSSLPVTHYDSRVACTASSYLSTPVITVTPRLVPAACTHFATARSVPSVELFRDILEGSVHVNVVGLWNKRRTVSSILLVSRYISLQALSQAHQAETATMPNKRIWSYRGGLKVRHAQALGDAFGFQQVHLGAGVDGTIAELALVAHERANEVNALILGCFHGCVL